MTTFNSAETDTLYALVDRVEERQVGPCRVLFLPTPVQSVVSFRGSFFAHPNVGAGDGLVQDLTTSLLDKGTRARDRFAIAEVLENRGATLQFTSDRLMVGFRGKALREDVAEVINVLGEQLREPLFDAEEFEKTKLRVAASLKRTLVNTGTQASNMLSRQFFPVSHPNFSWETEDLLARLEELSIEQVLAYHKIHFGANDFILAFVGDIDPDAIEQALRAALGDWEPHASGPAFEPGARPQAPDQIRRSIPGKMNIDVRIGHALSVLRRDAAFIPLFLATYILGGNFSARLMAVIRDQMGLTYHIRSDLKGISTLFEGSWVVRVTLSQDKLSQGLEATLAEVQRFVDGGATEAELQEKKMTVTGGFKVGLATTGGLASTLLTNARRGFDTSYLAQFPEEIEAVTLGQLNTALHQHLKPSQLHVAMAGMFEED